MRKIIAIIAAIILAFVIALGDQVIKMSLSDHPIGIKTIFGFGDDGTIVIPEKSQITTVTIKEPEELNLSYEERLEKGDYYFESGFLTFAANEYVKAANLEPNRLNPYLRLIQTNFDLNNFGKARTNAEQVLKLDPLNFEARYQLALISIKQNKFPGAEQIIEKLLNEGLTDPRLNYYKALIKITLGQHAEGKKLLRQLQPISSLAGEFHEKIYKILAGYEEFEFAKAAEELYLSELLARAFNQIGEYEMAIYKSKEILTIRSDLRDAWILLGFAYLNLEKYLFAATSFEHAYEIDPEWPATQYFLGITYFELAQFDDAIIYFNYALSNGFEPAIVIERKLADLYLDVGNYKESVETYEEVLAKNKQDINAFVRPIWIYLDFLNEPGKALRLGETAVVTFPNEAMAYNLLGWSQIGTKNYVESEKNLKKAIEMDPTLPAARYNLGKLYEELDNTKAALESYQKAYELDQNGSIGNLAAKRYNTLLIE